MENFPEYTEYKVLSGSLTTIASDVQKHLKEGWILIGGIAVETEANYGTFTHNYLQAMAR